MRATRRPRLESMTEAAADCSIKAKLRARRQFLYQLGQQVVRGAGRQLVRVDALQAARSAPRSARSGTPAAAAGRREQPELRRGSRPRPARPGRGSVCRRARRRPTRACGGSRAPARSPAAAGRPASPPRRRTTGWRCPRVSLRRNTTSPFHSRAATTDVAHPRVLRGQRAELVVVRREQRLRADPIVEVLGDRPGDRHAVVGRRAAPDLVERRSGCARSRSGGCARSRASRP